MKRLVKKFFNFRFILFLAAVGGSTIVGCNKNALSPVAPVRPVGLSVSIPYSQEIKSNLLGSTSNNILYRFTAPGLAPVSGSAGPFSPAGNSGTIDFSATLPSGAPWLLAVELDDAPTHQPLALGAVQLPSGTATGSVSLVMGSIARNCYRIDTWNYVAGSSFTFMNEALQTGTTGPGDISLSPVGAGGFSNSGHQFNRGLHRLYGERVFGEFRRGPDHRLRLLLCRLKGGLRFDSPIGGRLLRCPGAHHPRLGSDHQFGFVGGWSFLPLPGEYDSRLLRI